MKAIKTANHTGGVIVGGILGAPGGPGGMIAGGIGGGMVIDGIHTGIESADKGKYSPNGFLDNIDKIVENKNSTNVMDGIAGLITGPALDGLGGFMAGKAF